MNQLSSLPAAEELSGITVAYLGADDALQRHGAAWRGLAQRLDAMFFKWPAVYDAWRLTCSEGAEPGVLLAWKEGRLVGVLPVMQARMRRGPGFVPHIDYGPFDSALVPGGRRLFPVRQVSSVVSWRATWLRPSLLAEPALRGAVIRALTRHLAGLAQIDQIVLPVREEEQAVWLDALRAAGLAPWVHQLRRKVLTLEQLAPFDTIVAGQNKRYRQNVRRARAAAAEAGIRLETRVGWQQVAPKMDALSELAAESWKGQGAADGRVVIPFDARQRAFFERALSAGESGIEPVLSLGTTRDGVVSALLSARHGETLTALLTFRNDRYPKASAGLLAIGAGIDWGAEQGLRRFDLNSTQDWTRHLSDSSHMLVNVCAFLPTLRGRAYDLIARTRRRWEAPANATA